MGAERQFTQDQMPIQCAKKRPNNVLTWMEKQKQGNIIAFYRFESLFQETS